MADMSYLAEVERLADAGVTLPQIALLVGKSEATIRVALDRREAKHNPRLRFKPTGPNIVKARDEDRLTWSQVAARTGLKHEKMAKAIYNENKLVGTDVIERMKKESPLPGPTFGGLPIKEPVVEIDRHGFSIKDKEHTPVPVLDFNPDRVELLDAYVATAIYLGHLRKALEHQQREVDTALANMHRAAEALGSDPLGIFPDLTSKDSVLEVAEAFSMPKPKKARKPRASRRSDLYYSCERWLQREVGDGTWHRAAEVFAKGAALGYRETMIRQARSDLGIVTRKGGYQGLSYWATSKDVPWEDPNGKPSEDSTWKEALSSHFVSM